MVASWEIRAQQQVFCAILHTEVCPMAWSFGFKNLIIPGTFQGFTGMPFDHARNAAVQTCLSGPWEFLFFLDSDVVPPRDAILRLLSHRLPFVNGMYCRRSPPHSVPVMIKNHQWHTNFPLGSMQEADLVGSGCQLIHRSLLEKVAQCPQRPGKTWFDWRVDMKEHMPAEDCLSEDFTFCAHIRKLFGVPTLIDTSIQARHIGMAQATYGQFVPCETTPHT